MDFFHEKYPDAKKVIDENDRNFNELLCMHLSEVLRCKVDDYKKYFYLSLKESEDFSEYLSKKYSNNHIPPKTSHAHVSNRGSSTCPQGVPSRYRLIESQLMTVRNIIINENDFGDQIDQEIQQKAKILNWKYDIHKYKAKYIEILKTNIANNVKFTPKQRINLAHYLLNLTVHPLKKEQDFFCNCINPFFKRAAYSNETRSMHQVITLLLTGLKDEHDRDYLTIQKGCFTDKMMIKFKKNTGEELVLKFTLSRFGH